MENESKCPFTGGANTSAGASQPNAQWWPNQLNLKILHQNSPLSDPMDEDFDYAEEFKSLDLEAVKADIEAVMTIPKSGGPRTTATTVHSSSAWRGTVRARTESVTAAVAPDRVPSASHPQQLARQRQSRQGAPTPLVGQAKVRPQDLLGGPDDPRGQLRARVMGFATFGFAGGRVDIWEPEEDTYWGPKQRGWETSVTPATATSTIPSRGTDGTHLREPRRPNGNPIRSWRPGTSVRHSAHGDE